MNFIKRAFCSLWYRKKTFLLLFAVFFVQSLLILTGFSLQAGCRQAAQEMRENIGAWVTVNNFHTESSDIFYGADLLTPETVETIAAHPLVRGVNPFVYSMAMASDDIAPIVSDIQKEKFGPWKNSWMRVEGTYELEQVSEFVAHNAMLAEGRVFTHEDAGAAVISSDIALESGISLGDVITLTGFYTEEEQGSEYHGSDAQVEVVGIYAVQNYAARTDLAFYNTENVVYVTPDVAYQLNGMENVYNVRFELSDPLQAEQFVADMQAMGLADSENFEFVIDTTQYRSMQSAIDSMTKLASLMSATAIIMGGVVLVMMLMITLKDREFEVGVLLSMGENRGKILAQLLLESLVPVLAAMTASLSCNGFGQQAVGALFATTIQAVATPGVVFAMYVVGIMLVVVSSGVTAWKIARYQPKAILMAVE